MRDNGRAATMANIANPKIDFPRTGVSTNPEAFLES
jgi:hypothetical protein